MYNISNRSVKVGDTYPTNEGDTVVVKEYLGNKKYLVSFCHTNTPANFTKEVRVDHIKNGTIKNPYFPSVYGNGYIGDFDGIVRNNPAYSSWHRMLERCFSDKLKEKYPTYINVTCCDDWLNFSNFLKWYEKEAREDYELDKDILFKNNKLYSPETCCFIPSELNKILTRSDESRGKYPLGVHYHKRIDKFAATVRYNNVPISLGYFSTVEEAFNAYKVKKEEIIKLEANKYFDSNMISEKIYNALISYEVSIND